MSHGESGAPVQRFTIAELASVIILAIAGGVITSLQPLLLSALVHDGRLTTVQLGRAATAELLGMAIVAGIAGASLKPRHLRRIALGAAMLAVTANVATMMVSDNMVMLTRLVCGCCSGLLLWLLVGMTVRAAAPARLVGIYASSQSVVALVIASLFSSIILPRFGASGGFACLVGLNLLMVVPILFMPRDYVTLTPSATDEAAPAMSLPSGFGMLALISPFAYLAAVIGLWVYIVPLAGQMGQSSGVTSFSISLAIVFQILGGLAAAIFATRLDAVKALVGCALAGIVAAAVLGSGASAVPFCIAIAIFGFVWMFAPPFHVPFLIAADPSRRTGMFITTSQLFGCAAGPFIASFVVSGANVSSAVIVSGALFALSLIVTVGVYALSPSTKLQSDIVPGIKPLQI